MPSTPDNTPPPSNNNNGGGGNDGSTLPGPTEPIDPDDPNSR